MIQNGKKHLISQIEEVRGVLNSLVCEEKKMEYNEEILKVSRQLDMLIVNYMVS